MPFRSLSNISNMISALSGHRLNSLTNISSALSLFNRRTKFTVYLSKTHCTSGLQIYEDYPKDIIPLSQIFWANTCTDPERGRTGGVPPENNKIK